MNKTLIAIDGNSLINRAYYAIQKPMITKQGLYTHGVYGFLNMLTKIKKDYEPEYLVVTFDRKAPTFRHLEYTEYKAGRKKMPSELAMQMPLLKEVLAAMNVKMLEIDGFEADDIIGTVAKRGEEEGLFPVIVTGDKDELQLASDKTKIVLTKRGVTEFEIYDADAMMEKYGFTSQQFIDYKGLMGDQSDNIPGIPGVGEKTAQNLLLQFGSIENMLANTDQIKNEKLRAKVEDNAQLAMMSKRLATIFTEVPLEIVFDEFKVIEPDYNALINMYVKLEFNTFLSKLKRPDGGAVKVTSAAQTSDQADIPVSEAASNMGFDVSKLEKHTINTLTEWNDMKSKIDKRLILKVFSNNDHLGKLDVYGISLLSTNIYAYIPINDNVDIMRDLIDFISQNQIKISGHMLKEDYFALLAMVYADDGLQSIKTKGAEIFSTEFDTAIAEYMIEPSRSKYTLAVMSMEYLKKELPDESSFLSGNAQLDLFGTGDTAYNEYGLVWCLTVAELLTMFAAKIDHENLYKIYNEIELPLIEVLAIMEYHGMAVDKKELEQIGTLLSGKIKEITLQIYDLAGEEFNINSPKQLGPILFEKLALPFGKKTKTGYATGAEILEKLQDEHPIVPLITEYRMLSKLNSTYVEGLTPLIGRDGKIRAHFNQTVTTTGRISCTEPNLQNIPIRQELGRTIRKAFVAEKPGHVLMGADYSQIELRVLAHVSGDQSLIDAFNNGDDIHKITAAKVFEVAEDDVTAIQRSRAKAVNFGVIYGMSEFGLATELGISRKEAGQYINEYFKKYETVKVYLDSLVQQCKANGYVTTLWNRKRHIPEIHASNFMVRQLGERLAMNTPIQGSAADIIKIAMIKVQRALLKSGLKAKLVLQVHDELVLDVPEDEVEAAQNLLKENMEAAMKLAVPLESSMNTGTNWYDLK